MEDDCNLAGCDELKFMCGQKHKYGMNCQTVSDARGRFLDISIRCPCSTSDMPPLKEASFTKYLKGVADTGNICFIGDNTYINKLYTATLYSGKNGKLHYNYSFYHSQLRILVECAFGMLIEQWRILRSCLP